MSFPVYDIVVTAMHPIEYHARKLETFAESSDFTREWITDRLINGTYQLDDSNYKQVMDKQIIPDWITIKKDGFITDLLGRFLLRDIGRQWIDSSYDAEYLRILQERNKGRVIMPFKGCRVKKDTVYINGIGQVKIDPIGVKIIYRVECYKLADGWFADIRTGLRQ